MISGVLNLQANPVKVNVKLRKSGQGMWRLRRAGSATFHSACGKIIRPVAQFVADILNA
jgi:hypothetical protein